MFSIMVKPAWMLLLYCMLPHQPNGFNACHLCEAPLNDELLVSQDKCDHLICLYCFQDGVVCRNCTQGKNPKPLLKRTSVSQPLSKLTACPSCHIIVFYEGDGFMTCTSCKKDSCASCEAIHDGMNCSEYYQSLSAEKKNKLQIKRCGKKVNLERAGKAFECGICLDSVECKDIASLTCGHHICINCTKTYINMTEQPVDASSMLFKCPIPDCEDTIPYQISNFLLKSKKSEAESLKAFTISGGGRYCPHGCENLIAADEVADYIGNPRSYICRKCHKGSCLACNTFPFHQGFSCELNKKEGAAKTLSLLKNTDAKQCPHCLIIIERIAGCNRVLCSHCSYHFCWICLKFWTKYSNNNGRQVGGPCNCNVWEGTKKDKSR